MGLPLSTGGVEVGIVLELSVPDAVLSIILLARMGQERSVCKIGAVCSPTLAAKSGGEGGAPGVFYASIREPHDSELG
jgi:hypothetical protein